jgi:hypothetical protein
LELLEALSALAMADATSLAAEELEAELPEVRELL